MNTQTMQALSAGAITALVLIWNEAPITDSPERHRVASAESEDRDVPNVNSGPATKQRSDAVVRGDRTGAGPAARPAKRDLHAPPTTTEQGSRTGIGPQAETGVPARGENVAH
jgi:hypothetical protein